MPDEEPDWIEPSCIARMARNGWTAVAIARTLGTSTVHVGQALQAADTAERGIDRKRIVNSRITRIR